MTYAAPAQVAYMQRSPQPTSLPRRGLALTPASGPRVRAVPRVRRSCRPCVRRPPQPPAVATPRRLPACGCTSTFPSSRKARNVEANVTSPSSPVRRLPVGPPFTIQFQRPPDSSPWTTRDRRPPWPARPLSASAAHGALATRPCFLCIQPYSVSTRTDRRVDDRRGSRPLHAGGRYGRDRALSGSARRSSSRFPRGLYARRAPWARSPAMAPPFRRRSPALSAPPAAWRVSLFGRAPRRSRSSNRRRTGDCSVDIGAPSEPAARLRHAVFPPVRHLA